MGNICCRIFKEQIDLINQLPEEERAIVLYQVINNCFNQIENQIDFSSLGQVVYNLLRKNIVTKEFSNNYGGARKGAGRPISAGKNQIENQIENQNENAYVSVSVSDIKDNIVDSSSLRNTRVAPTEEEVLKYARQQNEMAGMGGFAVTEQQAQDFYDYYTGIGWVLPNDANTPIRDWRPLLRKWVRNPKFQTKQDEQDEESSMDKYEFRSWFDDRKQRIGGK